MGKLRIIIVFISLFTSFLEVKAQTDSLPQNFAKTATKFSEQISDKSKKYADRIDTKTEKTLSKLVKWENKIKQLLGKASPETATKLFGEHSLTFTKILDSYRNQKENVNNLKKSYNQYNDKLQTGLGYLEELKLADKNVAKAKQSVEQLSTITASQEQLEKLIKERKRELIAQATQQLGKSKYLTKIDKETYYYVETIKNYREIFSDPQKAEELAFKILDKVPAFKEFVANNSMLAQLFGAPGASRSAASLQGLQTRASVNSLIQTQLSAGGPSAREALQQNLQAAKAQLSDLKDKVLKAGGQSSSDEVPDFKPNPNKSKTFKQRLVFGSDFQFDKPRYANISSVANLGLSLGYKINAKSTAGFGMAYKLSYGNIQRLAIKHEGIGLRSFVDWKLKKNLFVAGGFEMNYNESFKTLKDLPSLLGTPVVASPWQSSGLIGISKKVNFNSKKLKVSKIQVYYDLLHNAHIVKTQPVVFRVGYNL